MWIALGKGALGATPTVNEKFLFMDDILFDQVMIKYVIKGPISFTMKGKDRVTR